MKVKNLSKSLTEAQKLLLGVNKAFKTVYQVTPGSSYTVLGIIFYLKSSWYGSGTVIEIKDDADRYASMPLCLFEIEDPRVSSFWIVKTFEDGCCLLWPKAFFADFFHDRLSDGSKQEVQVFREVCQRLESEFE